MGLKVSVSLGRALRCTAFGTALFASPFAATSVSAQTFGLPQTVLVPSQGADNVTDGGEVIIQGGTPLFRPVAPAANHFAASVEYESWNTGTSNGYSRLEGDRTINLLRYTRGYEEDVEFGVTLPFLSVAFDGLGRNEGIGDVEFALRKYYFDASNPGGITTVLSLRGSLPTGKENEGLGIGKATFGPSLTVSKPVLSNTLLYVGAGYNFASGNVFGVNLENSLYGWAGGMTQVSNRLGFQYEATSYKTPLGEKYLSFLVGPRYSLTPTRAIQLNVRKETKAAGKPLGISLGYSSAF